MIVPKPRGEVNDGGFMFVCSIAWSAICFAKVSIAQLSCVAGGRR